MKRGRKIYDPAFKIKAVQLSKERTNVLELARELEKFNELEKKLKDAELECDILKKAIGIFCSLFLIYFKGIHESSISKSGR